MGVLAGIITTLGMKNVKRVEVYHSGYMRYKLLAFLARPFIRHYISVSKEAKLQLIEWFHIDERKIDVVYNGVDVEHIREIVHVENPKEGKVEFVSVGRLSFEKGFKTPIQAYAELKESGQLTGSTYTMIGDGAQRQVAEELAKGNVTFTGVIPRDSVYKRIAACDIMVLPSLWEGNSILMLEVLSLGKPMVLTDIPSFREVLEFEPLRDNERCRLEWFGVVFRKEDVDACKDAMCLAYDSISVLKSHTDKILLLGDKFSTKEQAERYLEIATNL
jgi:glycosyltransferase involved in cell wall biosynthesis